MNAVATWLLKTEPTEYPFADLRRDKATVWSGVSSPAGLKNLRAVAKGDSVLIYHTGDERAIVGSASVSRAAYPDPSLEVDDPKRVVIDVRAGRSAKEPVTLARIKADPRFGSFELVRQSRLSVVPVPEELDAILREWAGL